MASNEATEDRKKTMLKRHVGYVTVQVQKKTRMGGQEDDIAMN
jgi:hypothetical protein